MKKQSGEAWQIARSFLHLLSCAPGGRFFIIQSWRCSGHLESKAGPVGQSTSQGTARDSIVWDEAALPKSCVCLSWGPVPWERGKLPGMAIVSQGAPEGGEAAPSHGHKSPGKSLTLLVCEPRSGSALQQ